MEIIMRFVEMCAVFGANCTSVIFSYQPILPESLKE